MFQKVYNRNQNEWQRPLSDNIISNCSNGAVRAGITHPNLKLLKGANAAHFELYLKDFFGTHCENKVYPLFVWAIQTTEVVKINYIIGFTNRPMMTWNDYNLSDT